MKVIGYKTEDDGENKYIIQKHVCRNKNCPDCGREKETKIKE